jgi:hypothetical protein
MATKWERWAPLSGVLAVVCWIVGLLTVGETKDKADEILAQVRNDDARILIGSIIFLIGTGLFLWFLGSLRVRLMTAEGQTARVTAIAFAGGVVTAALLTGLPGTIAAAAINKHDIDAPTASAMVNLGDAFFLGAEYLLPVLVVAVAVVSIRHGAFPKWIAWLSVVMAIGLLIPWIGWAVLIFGLPLWTLILSILLWRDAEQPARIGQPATGATG